MKQTTLLLADNEIDFLMTRKELLEKEGYFVIQATAVDEAMKVLESGILDLAILDIRMEDNEDENDISGIYLAKNYGKSVPKIMLTAFPRYDYVVEVMRRDHLQGLPAAVDFVSKSEGVERLVQSIQKTLSTREVFIVHGHNKQVRREVSEFVKNLGLTPKILVELPSHGKTIIELLEDNANVGFAIVVCTADDIGGVRNSATSELQFRSRQNVIFEQGFFIGKLGRHRVVTLCEENIEMPSDYSGIIYIPMDDLGLWKERIRQEIESTILS